MKWTTKRRPLKHLNQSRGIKGLSKYHPFTDHTMFIGNIPDTTGLMLKQLPAITHVTMETDSNEMSLICHTTAMHSFMSWRKWYLIFGHGCDTTDSQMSPQPRRSRGCGDISESVVSQPWPKTRYHFLFYHGTTKLTLNWESLSSQTASQLPKFKGQSHCKHWVTWPDCFATPPSNHCDVTAGLVSLNHVYIFDKKMSQNKQWFKGN